MPVILEINQLFLKKFHDSRMTDTGALLNQIMRLWDRLRMGLTSKDQMVF